MKNISSFFMSHQFFLACSTFKKQKLTQSPLKTDAFTFQLSLKKTPNLTVLIYKKS